MVKKFRVEHAVPATSPLPLGLRLTKDMGPKTEDEAREALKLPYRELVGSLLYSAVTVRPDIAYATKELTKFYSCWGRTHQIGTHFKHACHVLRYLKATASRGLVFKSTPTADVLWCPHCGVRHEEPPVGEHLIWAGSKVINLAMRTTRAHPHWWPTLMRRGPTRRTPRAQAASSSTWMRIHWPGRARQSQNASLRVTARVSCCTSGMCWRGWGSSCQLLFCSVITKAAYRTSRTTRRPRRRDTLPSSTTLCVIHTSKG
mmetsp:Transcript_25584/g.63382  ORF Transcript_25584/g.63382 Transcript_25584/m.63382 type:complete len:259 (+) Transcript_25584:798-1574(+)